MNPGPLLRLAPALPLGHWTTRQGSGGGKGGVNKDTGVECIEKVISFLKKNDNDSAVNAYMDEVTSCNDQPPSWADKLAPDKLAPYLIGVDKSISDLFHGVPMMVPVANQLKSQKLCGPLIEDIASHQKVSLQMDKQGISSGDKGLVNQVRWDEGGEKRKLNREVVEVKD